MLINPYPIPHVRNDVGVFGLKIAGRKVREGRRFQKFNKYSVPVPEIVILTTIS
jgi:hypothetical protein